MDTSIIERAFRLSRRGIFGVILVTLVLVGILAGERYAFEQAMMRITADRLSAEKHIGAVLVLDEVLTMSARMAAQSNDQSWVKRYTEHEPKMSKALDALVALAPPAIAKAFTEATSVANDKLVALEKRSFELLAINQQAEASRIFESAEYRREKETLVKGSDVFTEALQSALDARSEALRRRWLGIVAFLLVGMAMMGIAWFFLARVMNGTVKSLETAESLRAAADRERFGLQQEREREHSAREARAAQVAGDVREFGRSAEQSFAATLAGIEDLRKSAERVVENNGIAGDVTRLLKASSESTNALIASSRSRFDALDEALQALARTMHDSNGLSRATAQDVSNATKAVHQLAERVRSISAIVNMIDGIASQTNLLALNATIEAARAGEAGRGFAVVASEVKTLAQQTSNSTEAITKTVQDIEAGMEQVVSSMDKVFGSMERVANSADEVTRAIEEQRLSSTQILEDFRGAAGFAERVAEDMLRVDEANRTTADTIAALDEATRTLAEATSTLHVSTKHFLDGVQAA